MVEPFAGHQKVVIMGKFLSYIIFLIALVSCQATRNMESTSDKRNVDSVAASAARIEREQRAIDTTRTETGKVTITEIEFFPPTEIEQPQPEPDKPKKTQPPTTASVDLSNVGKVQGAVKSIKQTVIESDVEEKGESKESSESNETESAATVTKATESTDKQQEQPPDPYRWRYIFFIALLSVSVLLYLKRTPIVNWIRKILSGILKIL